MLIACKFLWHWCPNIVIVAKVVRKIHGLNSNQSNWLFKKIICTSCWINILLFCISIWVLVLIKCYTIRHINNKEVNKFLYLPITHYIFDYIKHGHSPFYTNFMWLQLYSHVHNITYNLNHASILHFIHSWT